MALNELNRRIPLIDGKRFVCTDVTNFKTSIEADLPAAQITAGQVSQYLSQVDQLLREAESQAVEGFVRRGRQQNAVAGSIETAKKPDFSVLTPLTEDVLSHLPEPVATLICFTCLLRVICHLSAQLEQKPIKPKRP